MPYDLKSFRGSGGSVGSWQQQAACPMTFRMDENAIALLQTPGQAAPGMEDPFLKRLQPCELILNTNFIRGLVFLEMLNKIGGQADHTR